MFYHIDLNSITFKLEGYELGKEITNIKLTTDCKDIKFNSTYGIDYVVYNTPSNRDYLSASSHFSLYDDMFLHVTLVLKDNVMFGMNFSEKNIVIEGLGSSECVIWGENPIVVFRLPKFEYPHNHGGTWIDEVPASCTDSGTKGHYECTVCGKYFDEENAEIADLTINALGHTWSTSEIIAEVPASCTASGTKAHWHCNTCNKDFESDETTEVAELTIAAKGHTWSTDEIIAEVPASCTANGTKAHWHCNTCNKDFESDETTEITELTIAAKGHNFGEWIEEVAATEKAEGVKAHKDCTVCGKHFDENGNELESLVIEKLPESGLSGGAIAGIAVGGTAVLGCGGFSIFWFLIKKKKFSDLF